jgi:SAM-dependent methyltransferase
MIQPGYCLLYHQEKHKQESTSTGSSEHADTEKTNDACSYWQTFEWTSQELKNTQEVLDSHLSTSDLIINNPQGRGKYIKDNLEHNAHQHWDNFYTQHQTKFFKDRHYLHKAFPHEFGILYQNHDTINSNQVDPNENMHHDRLTVIEIGCGVGNTVLPLLELHPWITIDSQSSNFKTHKKLLQVWGLDFSSIAIDLLKQDERFLQANQQYHHPRAHAAVWDITQHYPQEIDSRLHQAADISMLLFCFSAIAPSKMVQAAKHVADTLKPGGVLIFRDYGRYDEAQIKLGTSRRKRLGDNYYVKHDLTRVYYFDLDDLRRLFGSNDCGDSDVTTTTTISTTSNKCKCVGAGLEILELKYIQRLYTNRSNGDIRRRVWVQGRFRKPII